MQKWKLITFQYGRRGKYDPDAATPLLVTDDLHRIRSDLAEDATRRAAAAHPLPAEAANGGRHGADQNSKDEILLTRGESDQTDIPVCLRSHCSIMCSPHSVLSSWHMLHSGVRSQCIQYENKTCLFINLLAASQRARESGRRGMTRRTKNTRTWAAAASTPFKPVAY